MLDLHTHILPGVDDGSRSVRQSLAMLQAEAKQGVDCVMLTPHFYAHRESPEHFLKRRSKAIQMLEQTADRKGLPERIPGAEVAYFRGISRADGIESLCLGDTGTMLIEMPFRRWSRNMIDELVFLRKSRGVRPILAHVERYMRYQPLGTVGELCDSGIWMQANDSFFLSWQTSWLALRMLKKHRIQFIGSDCHGTKKRPPDMEDAIVQIEWGLGFAGLDYLERMERRLLEGGTR